MQGPERKEARFRNEAWGRERLTPIERFGSWLSLRRLRRTLGPLAGKDVGDFGCGYRGGILHDLLDQVRSATLVDVSLDERLKARPSVRAIEGVLPDVLEHVADESLDAVICNNVLEHLWQRGALLRHVRRVLRAGGTAFINVPSWRGKWFLETAAFRLRLTSYEEIDDHKTYFEVRELWQLLVESGFFPSEIRCASHKFGLNTYAVCKVRPR